MYREIITPTQSDLTIHLPKEMVGRKVEVIAFDIEEQPLVARSKKPSLEEIKEFYSHYNVDMSDFKFNREEANER